MVCPLVFRSVAFFLRVNPLRTPRAGSDAEIPDFAADAPCCSFRNGLAYRLRALLRA